MHRIRLAQSCLVAMERWLLSAMLGVIVVLSFLQVVLRGGFSAGFLWADTFLRHLVLWLGFLGGAAAAAQDKQFAMDAASLVLKGRLRAAVHLGLHLFTAAVSAALARASWRFLADEYRAGGVLFSIGDLHVPPWTFELILPAGFALLVVHYALKAAEAALELRG